MYLINYALRNSLDDLFSIRKTLSEKALDELYRPFILNERKVRSIERIFVLAGKTNIYGFPYPEKISDLAQYLPFGELTCSPLESETDTVEKCVDVFLKDHSFQMDQVILWIKTKNDCWSLEDKTRFRNNGEAPCNKMFSFQDLDGQYHADYENMQLLRFSLSEKDELTRSEFYRLISAFRAIKIRSDDVLEGEERKRTLEKLDGIYENIMKMRRFTNKAEASITEMHDGLKQ